MDQQKVGGEEKREENQLLGERLTPEGWKEVRWRNNEEVLVDPFESIPLDAPIKPLNKKFKDKHRHALNLIFSSVNQVKEVKRHVPILREELMNKLKLEKQVIKDLVDWGLLEQVVIPLEMGSKKMGGRAVIIPTHQSRILMRSIERALLEVLNATKEKSESLGSEQTDGAGERTPEVSTEVP